MLKRLARAERDDSGREKRETREAMRPYSRMLGKISHASPLGVLDALVQVVRSKYGEVLGYLFEVLDLNRLQKSYSSSLWLLLIHLQVECYSNQIEPVIDALRYMSLLSFDMLTFVVLTRLTSGRDKIKDDGVNIADWLQNLSSFNALVGGGWEGMEDGVFLSESLSYFSL